MREGAEHYGADVCVGSLIKNPGGGLAPTGGYIVGTQDAVERIAYRLTAPGIGLEVGSYAASYQPFYQGLFMAPHTVAQAIKTACLAARVFEILGMTTTPAADEPRGRHHSGDSNAHAGAPRRVLSGDSDGFPD